jgi:serine phosphatase RsbU (regulator of sigma subunit)
MAIMPRLQTIYESLPQSFVLFKPRDIVSGDFFWFAQTPQHILIAAVDCTGHGVPGAFMSVMGSTILNQIVNERKIYDPSLILDALNAQVKLLLKQVDKDSDSNDGMDIGLTAVNFETRTFTFAAANRPLYFIRDGVIEEVKGTKKPIGGRLNTDEDPFVDNVFEFRPGDAVYMSSDGYADQFGGPQGRKFMSKRFKELLLEIYQKPPAEQCQILDDTIENWKAEAEQKQMDDILVIGVRF